jgi:Cu+-exporting ATPase
MDALHLFEKEHTFEITRPLSRQSDTIFEVSYTPNPPAFTIRDILSRIASIPCTSSHQSAFEASLYHPPTLESLSQAAQVKERKALLWRLIVNLVVAVPTFIVGVVFTSLLPAGNSTRHFLDAPLWSGTTSRSVWALFILATPIEFYCSLTFHTKAIKEIAALWSSRSKVPYWKRFVRFGSMNLLMSLGISVAYFSSVALLAISSVTPATGEESGMGTTYFDSVIFLSMFLLIGGFRGRSTLRSH